MTFRSNAIRVLAGSCWLAATAFAAPKGNYVLVDQGQAGGKAFSALGFLSLDGAGNVKGSEVYRASGVNVSADLAGTYIMSSANGGTMSLTAKTAEGDGLEFVQNYRFLVTDDNELYALRTDPGVLSNSFLYQSNAASATGPFALNELNREGETFATLAQISADTNGVVSGKAYLVRSAGITEATVSGSYAPSANGLGALSLTLSFKDDAGETQDVAYRYRTAASRDGIKAIRLDAGAVTIANIEVQ